MPKVAEFNKMGSIHELKWVDKSTPKPSPGEILIDVRSFGINHSERDFVQGKYVQRPQFPSRIGYEATGVITGLGEGVTNWKLGDRVNTVPVFSMSKYGTWAENAVVPARALVKAPKLLDDVRASAAWVAYAAAWGGLVYKGQLKKGDYVLITGAAGSPGLAALDIANQYEAIPIAVTRSHDKVRTLKKLGAHHVIVSSEENRVDRIMEITQQHGVDVVFDCIAGPGLEELAQMAAHQAALIVYGMLSTAPTPLPLFPAFEKNLSFHGFTVKDVFEDPEIWPRAERELRTGFNNGLLMPVVSRSFNQADWQEALQYLQNKGRVGKVVIKLK
ncbi:zinc-dependent alcohol dehydrogenase family protein [bacterium SCSIO 12741]|nr:zinc-dependent alcohol dehydrogenase family protein [bacterium SCSIO 12741]